MRFLVLLVVIEAALLGLVVALSRARTHDEATHDVGPAALGTRRDHSEVTQQQARHALAAAFQTARRGLDQRLSAEEKAAGLGVGLQDVILRAEGIYDPTRVGVFGPAMRMQVRPGTAAMTDVYAGRWTRLSADPNLHRRVGFIAEGWLHPRAAGCGDFWMFRREDTAVMLDSLTPSECARRADGADSAAPVVAALLSLPVFAAPYPGNRLSHEQLRADQEARIQTVLQKRWFRSRIFSSAFGGSSL